MLQSCYEANNIYKVRFFKFQNEIIRNLSYLILLIHVTNNSISSQCFYFSKCSNSSTIGGFQIEAFGESDGGDLPLVLSGIIRLFTDSSHNKVKIQSYMFTFEGEQLVENKFGNWYETPSRLDIDFHTFFIKWTKGRFSFFIDDQVFSVVETRKLVGTPKVRVWFSLLTFGEYSLQNSKLYVDEFSYTPLDQCA